MGIDGWLVVLGCRMWRLKTHGRRGGGKPLAVLAGCFVFFVKPLSVHAARRMTVDVFCGLLD
jgi:hypothetical protein